MDVKIGSANRHYHGAKAGWSAFCDSSFNSASSLTTSPPPRERTLMVATRPLLVNRHWVVECGLRAQILIVRRTANAYASVAEVRSSFDGVVEVVDALTRTNMSLLVDMRLAPPRNDPEFERAADDQPKYLTRDFMRSAALIRTAIGLLHVQRHMQQMGLPVKVFADEQQALDYLLGRTEPASIDVTNPPSKRRP